VLSAPRPLGNARFVFVTRVAGKSILSKIWLNKVGQKHKTLIQLLWLLAALAPQREWLLPSAASSAVSSALCFFAILARILIRGLRFAMGNQSSRELEFTQIE
jgi:hypothetical protein